ncbi:Putative membrane protein [Sphingopyxis fribergensis]|uniref:Putative membrane protein n=1 Tax=Sphingopyxis fribergensis TaxID=1515612 RepID=A0A0A7PKB6_9SPHN|nr:hypothetical protein [Sphingopyxis fribergensis]AJA08382.1 Putative membrane protein [Sphingopyxis fribergensis]
MGKKLSFAASRHKGVRLFRWSVLALAGVTAGAMLGEMAAGTRLGGETGGRTSYSNLSANPDALVAQRDGGILPCPGCADSYGVALRLRADRDIRMSDEFRELGAVDIDPPILADPGDDYRYGGRFPDPEPHAAATSEDLRAVGTADESPALDVMLPTPAEY